MKILILASSFSGLCQRVLRELVIAGHTVDQHYGMEEDKLRKQLQSFSPELVVCPFLTHRIPTDVWQNYTCLIVHPGIEGDRGPSSIDWAISENLPYWGVTLLQAAEEMDAGDIWGTSEFPLRKAGKTSVYKREVSSAAVKLIKQAIAAKSQGTVSPRALDYSNPSVKGTLKDLMRQSDRKIQWSDDTSETILAKLNAADTSPGVLDSIGGYPVRLFGGRIETSMRGEPGEILAIRYGAMCRATADGAIWIRQLKCSEHPVLPNFKLPADQVLKQLLTQSEFSALCDATIIETANDIRVDTEGSTAYIYFDFYNGAASTQQCQRLVETINAVKQQESVNTLVFMGGEDFFSNGIHLNCIEAAANPAEESWQNINAIDDVVHAIIDSPDHVTVAALRNNAGAGGAILALACDQVIIREGVVLNPHYQNMGLFGSEYWTYLLPKKVGEKQAEQITNECQPMLASEALQLQFADQLLDENWDDYHDQLKTQIQQLNEAKAHQAVLEKKAQVRTEDEKSKPLEQYRQEELVKMRETFFDPDSRYHQERREFVYKGKVPQHLKQTILA